jgi:uncharacterized membrane protein YcjF (UPF0283 family)
MNLWTWVLIGLCALGVLLPVVSAVPVVLRLLHLRSRAKELRRARLFTSLQSLDVQAAHLSHTAAEANALAQRAQNAIARIRSAPDDAGYTRALEAMHSTGSEIHALFETLK